MIELPNGKVARTLPEQVGHLTKEIENIWDFIDGINVQDNLVKVTASSGTLTAKEMEIVSRSVAFIEYNDNLYVKANTTATEFIFKQIALSASDQGTYNILQSFRIVVTKASGAYAYSSNTVLSLYNKSEMDTLLAAKANASALDAKADLSGADFTGEITAPSIIEKMGTKYTYTVSGENDPTQVNLENLYCGIVKTGNKLTVVCFTKITRLDSISTGGAMVNLGIFTVPKEVGNKLYPEVSNRLSSTQVYVSIDYSTGTTLPVNIYKNEGTDRDYLTIRLYNCNNLTANTVYYCRVEATFLLSDNLAS